jgi:hypothetical protein
VSKKQKILLSLAVARGEQQAASVDTQRECNGLMQQNQDLEIFKLKTLEALTAFLASQKMTGRKWQSPLPRTCSQQYQQGFRWHFCGRIPKVSDQN